MFGYTNVIVYRNGQYEMIRRFRDRNLAIRIAQTINTDTKRGRRAILDY